MEATVGIPISLLFTALGALGLFIFMEERRAIRGLITTVKEAAKKGRDDLEKKLEDKLEDYSKKIERIESSSRELSRKEFEVVKQHVEDSISAVIGSKKFSDDLKSCVKECMLHFEQNRSIGEASMFEEFRRILEASMKDIHAKIQQIT